MNRGWSRKTLINKRRLARELLDEGKSVAVVARALGVSSNTIYNWRKLSPEALKEVHPAGPKPACVDVAAFVVTLYQKGEKISVIRDQIIERFGRKYTLGHIVTLAKGRPPRTPRFDCKSRLRILEVLRGFYKSSYTTNDARGLARLPQSWDEELVQQYIRKEFGIEITDHQAAQWLAYAKSNTV